MADALNNFEDLLDNLIYSDENQSLNDLHTPVIEISCPQTVEASLFKGFGESKKQNFVATFPPPPNISQDSSNTLYTINSEIIDNQLLMPSFDRRRSSVGSMNGTFSDFSLEEPKTPMFSCGLAPPIVIVPGNIIRQIPSPLYSPLSSVAIESPFSERSWSADADLSQVINIDEQSSFLNPSVFPDQMVDFEAEIFAEGVINELLKVSVDPPTNESTLGFNLSSSMYRLATSCNSSSYLKSPKLRNRSFSPYSSQNTLQPPMKTRRSLSVNDIPEPIKVQCKVSIDGVDSNEQQPQRVLYQCPHEACGKQFTRPFNLKNHYLAEHTSERPHKCEYCLKAFVRSHDLKRHVKSRHEYVF